MRRPGVLFTFAAAAFWWVVVSFIPAPISVEMLTALLLPLSALALWRWMPGALHNLLQPHITPAQILTIAVATMSLAVAFQSIWRLIYRWLGWPDRMADSPWVGFPIFGLLVTLILYLLSTRRRTDPPMPVLLIVVMFTAALVLITGFLIRNTLNT